MKINFLTFPQILVRIHRTQFASDSLPPSIDMCGHFKPWWGYAVKLTTDFYRAERETSKDIVLAFFRVKRKYFVLCNIYLKWYTSKNFSSMNFGRRGHGVKNLSFDRRCQNHTMNFKNWLMSFVLMKENKTYRFECCSQ